MSLQLCRDSKTIASSKTSTCYCVPFLFSNFLVGGARFYLSSSSLPSPLQERLMKEIAPVIASVFQRVQLERLMKKRNDSFGVEQHRIARDVHDTLGHSLAYLRLRLDQISMEINQTETKMLRKEVEALRDTAKEAYDQMRDVLVALTPEGSSDLNGILLHYVDMIQQRGNYKINLRMKGQPHILLPFIQRHVFFIFREALTNVEKHSHAQAVDVDLDWQESGVEIRIVDDGTGFDTMLAVQNGHFGLKNMQERAMESNAQLSITSQPGHGARLTLCVPYKDES